jgi:hypothetical protein
MRENLSISMPSVIDLLPGKKLGNAHFVHSNQPISIHKAVEQLAYYFKREGRYDFVQYCTYEDKDNKKSESYIWTDTDWDDKFIVGAINFRFLGDVGQNNEWSLEWVWFHPYYRNRGLLSEAWPHFQKKYGKNFRIEPPLSKAMQRFIDKMNPSESKVCTCRGCEMGL